MRRGNTLDLELLGKLGSPAADVAPLAAPIRHRLTAKTWIPSDSSPPTNCPLRRWSRRMWVVPNGSVHGRGWYQVVRCKAVGDTK